MSERFTIKRRIEIDMAHRVPDHASKCYAIHGHRYVIEAICSGPLYHQGEQAGMVMDFGFLKELMIQEIHNPCDHGLVLVQGDPAIALLVAQGTPSWLKLRAVHFIPTAENLAKWWFDKLEIAMLEFFADRNEREKQKEVRLDAVIVHETPNSIATFYRQNLKCEAQP